MQPRRCGRRRADMDVDAGRRGHARPLRDQRRARRDANRRGHGLRVQRRGRPRPRGRHRRAPSPRSSGTWSARSPAGRRSPLAASRRIGVVMGGLFLASTLPYASLVVARRPSVASPSGRSRRAAAVSAAPAPATMPSRYLRLRARAGLVVRPLRNGDVETVMAVFERLGDESRRTRFNGPKPRLSAVELEQLAAGRRDAPRPRRVPRGARPPDRDRAARARGVERRDRVRGGRRAPAARRSARRSPRSFSRTRARPGSPRSRRSSRPRTRPPCPSSRACSGGSRPASRGRSCRCALPWRWCLRLEQARLLARPARPLGEALDPDAVERARSPDGSRSAGGAS